MTSKDTSISTIDSRNSAHGDTRETFAISAEHLPRNFLYLRTSCTKESQRSIQTEIETGSDEESFVVEVSLRVIWATVIRKIIQTQ